jgi:hypothetical protein
MRFAIAVWITAEHADEEAEVVIWIEGEACAGRSKRIGRAAVGQIDAGDRRPAPVGVEKRTRADDALGVGRKLAEAK